MTLVFEGVKYQRTTKVQMRLMNVDSEQLDALETEWMAKLRIPQRLPAHLQVRQRLNTPPVAWQVFDVPRWLHIAQRACDLLSIFPLLYAARAGCGQLVVSVAAAHAALRTSYSPDPGCPAMPRLAMSEQAQAASVGHWVALAVQCAPVQEPLCKDRT